MCQIFGWEVRTKNTPILPKSNLKISTIDIKIPNSLEGDLKINNLKFCVEDHTVVNDQENPKKKSNNKKKIKHQAVSTEIGITISKLIVQIQFLIFFKIDSSKIILNKFPFFIC